MRKIAIITARAGSKGLANKNVLMVDGKPLLAYSIESALEADIFDEIIISTDSQEYIDLLAHYPIIFRKRPEHLALDTSSSFEAIEDVLMQDYGKCDYFVILQPTSPLRKVEQIREVCQKFEKNYDKFDYLVSVSNAHKISVLVKTIEEDGSMKNFGFESHKQVNRQNYAPEYSPNGVYFVAKSKEYLVEKNFYGPRSLAYFMSKQDSIDIDDRDDFDYFYYRVLESKRLELMREQALREIKIKDSEFNKEADISLIGDVILAKYSKKTDISVQNLAILNIDIDTYINEIINKGLIDKLSNKIIISIGINDIRKQTKTLDELIASVCYLVDTIRCIKPNAQIYYLGCLKTLFRADCDNKLIEEYNTQMSAKLNKTNITFIDINSEFCDKYGKLAQQYTNDGLNLNDNGYTLLETLLLQITY